MPDEGIDPGGPAEHRLQVWEGRQLVEIRMHEREIVDVRQIAGLRPDSNFQVWQLLLERIAPGRPVADMLVEIDDEQGHASS